MVLKLSLSAELEDRLRQEAERRGVSLDAVTIELLEKHLPLDAPAESGQIRRHDAFLKGYAPQDEGLYDDLHRLGRIALPDAQQIKSAWTQHVKPQF